MGEDCPVGGERTLRAEGREDFVETRRGRGCCVWRQDLDGGAIYHDDADAHAGAEPRAQGAGLSECSREIVISGFHHGGCDFEDGKSISRQLDLCP